MHIAIAHLGFDKDTSYAGRNFLKGVLAWDKDRSSPPPEEQKHVAQTVEDGGFILTPYETNYQDHSWGLLYIGNQRGTLHLRGFCLDALNGDHLSDREKKMFRAIGQLPVFQGRLFFHETKKVKIPIAGIASHDTALLVHALAGVSNEFITDCSNSRNI